MGLQGRPAAAGRLQPITVQDESEVRDRTRSGAAR